MIPWDAARGIEIPLAVATYDIDFAGTVGNIVFVRWLEDLRLALMAEAYPIARALAEDVAPMLLETKIRYAKPVQIGDALRGRMWVTAMERVRWRVAAEFRVGDTVHAHAEQEGIFFKLSTRRPVAPPEPLKARFAP